MMIKLEMITIVMVMIQLTISMYFIHIIKESYDINNKKSIMLPAYIHMMTTLIVMTMKQ